MDFIMSADIVENFDRAFVQCSLHVCAVSCFLHGIIVPVHMTEGYWPTAFRVSHEYLRITPSQVLPCTVLPSRLWTRASARSWIVTVCAHAGDVQPYLAQGSSMQQNGRNQTQCTCETFEEERLITNRVTYLIYAGLMPQ